MTSTVTYQTNLRTECTHIASKSTIHTDAPIDNKGKGELFSPTDIVATALASCMITVMGIKAEQSNIHFTQVNATVTKLMASDPRRISTIEIEIEVGDRWSEKEQKIMENTAKTCPVAQSLHPDIKQEIAFIYK
ncbi:MAG TPA: osmotically inducible protein OsmC [Bacteroidetes bacterium]|jgi:putative redox protein|nr:osmotically inducible protein OsmC [Bacteroidota bacterium]|tara:strand:+ start:19618 stop:20019 length:402 start_codon:yes stop_codon:yes gene_type:complete